jgi:hypothetical protein
VVHLVEDFSGGIGAVYLEGMVTLVFQGEVFPEVLE